MVKKTTTSPQLKTALDALIGLNLDELKQATTRAATLMRTLGGKPVLNDAQPIPQDDWILEGLYTALRHADRKWMCLPFGKLVDLPAYRKSYVKFAPLIRSDIESRFKPALSPAEKISLGETLGTAFLDYVWERSQVTHLSGLLYRIELYAEAMENAFPNYAANGLLRALLKGRSLA
jgi:hypothetical protein